MKRYGLWLTSGPKAGCVDNCDAKTIEEAENYFKEHCEVYEIGHYKNEELVYKKD